MRRCQCWLVVMAACLPHWSARAEPQDRVPRVAASPAGSAVSGSISSPRDDDAPDSEDSLDDLTIVLTNWTRVGATVRTLNGHFTRHEYDATRSLETVGTGRIHFEAGGRALYAIDAPASQKLSRSTRVQDNGRPYQIQAVVPETLYWVQGQFARVDPVRREFEMFEIPEPFQTTNAVDAVESWDVIWTTLGCLQRRTPGLIETDLNALRERFEWTLVGIDENHVVLTGKPLTAAERRHYSAVHVHLDSKSYLTKGTKVVDSTGASEIVHIFEDLRVNVPPEPGQADWSPDLARMKLLTAPPLAPPASGGR